jgi:beta-lactam-binding protein with PASTA domain
MVFAGSPDTAQNRTDQPKAALLGLPLSFEANQGQTDSQVKFLSRGDGYALFLTSNEAVFTLRTAAGEKASPSVFRMELLGANRDAQVSGAEKMSGVANYYIGNDPKKWRTGVDTYGKVKYQGIYPGVDALFYGNQRQLEYDFVVAPGADPKQIALGLTGAKPSIDADGNVVLKLADGNLALKKPVVYQNIGGEKRSVDASYTIAGNKVHFRLCNYDRSQTLVIDPVFTYLTYLGGSNPDQIGSHLGVGQLGSPAQALALDSAGNVYVTGATLSTNFPVANAYQSTKPNSSSTWSVFVSALNPSGTALLYSTYLGGTQQGGGAIDQGCSIIWDSHDNAVYVVGSTDSRDFPVTAGAFLGGVIYNNAFRAFVAKFSAAGLLTNSTYLAANNSSLGGNVATLGFGVATDSLGQAYVTGLTQFNCTANPSLCFPTTPGAVIPAGTVSQNGDGFVSVFDPNLSTLLYSTLLGDPSGSQTSTSEAFGVTVDPNGNFYVVGVTGSPSLPTTPGAFQPALGTSNAQPLVGFAAKFGPVSANGATLTYLTYLEATGVSFGEFPSGVAADSQGNAYVGGYSNSPTFPVTAGAYNTACPLNGARLCPAAFVTKLNPTGTGLVWSALVEPADYFGAIQLDTQGNVHVTGHNSGAFVAVNPVQSGLLTAGGFVAKLDPTGSTLLFSSLVGGADGAPSINLTGVAVDALGAIYVAGNINDATLPTTPGVVQPTFAGGSGQYGDGIIGKITLETPDLTIAKSHTGNFSQGQAGATYSLTVTNSGNGPTSGTVTVTENIPAGLTLTGMSGSGWTCATLPKCTRSDALPINGTYAPITVTVNVAANAPASVNNVASVAGGGQYNTANDNANDVTTINAVAQQVAVPNLVGQTQAAATTAIQAATLVLGTVTTTSSSTVPSGRVISESPVAGTLVNTGSAVNIVVSTGPAQVAVPNVVGQTQATATTTITSATLVVGTVTMASSSTVPSGSVISESPVAGTLVNTGSAVNLVVSTGPAQVAVPNVVGQTQAAATTAIQAATLVVGTVTTASSGTVPSGRVITESPVAGTLVNTGSAVNLVVSSGPAPTGPAVVSYSVLFGGQSYNVLGSTRNRLPWRVTGVRVVFSEPITGGNINSLTGVAPTGFSGLGTNTLTWTINPLSIGSFPTALAGSGANALTDSNGTPLANAGFSQTLKVLWGDFNDDGYVTSADMVGVNNASTKPYNILADINGDGVDNLADVQMVRGRLGTALP